MLRKTLDLLACPSCRGGYSARSHSDSSERIEQGYLQCPGCAVVIPIIDGFALFTEPLLHAGLATPAALATLSNKLFGTQAEFEAYARDKRVRQIVEPYAAFHPFNESTRALIPLLPHVRESLSAGDAVLDVWARTGWSAVWLAGLMPDQHIVSLWEGNSSVLGYRGYRHLLGSEQRPANLDVIFAHPSQPLPFRTAAFAFTYAMDVLHRYPLQPLAGETLRVTRNDGSIVFAHLHLTNSEPEPFFERGCNKAHGRDYRAWLDELSAIEGRQSFVLGESTLFDGPDVAVLVDDPDTSDYNGLIAILPQSVALDSAACIEPASSGDCRYIVSPLFRFRLSRRQALTAPRLFDGAIERLLVQHPVYAARLPAGPRVLDDVTLISLLLAATGASNAQLQAAIPEQREAVAGALATLCSDELLHAAAIPYSAHRLQRFHANQTVFDGGCAALLSTLAAARHENLLVLPDATTLSCRDLMDFAAGIPLVLESAGLKAGDWLSVHVQDHPLLWIAALAASAGGIHVELLTGSQDSVRGALVLHGDGSLPPTGARLALGLDGSADGLLDRLLALAETTPLPWANASGIVECPIDGGRLRCSLDTLLEGCQSLAYQTERQLWSLGSGSLVMDLIILLSALSRGETLRTTY